MTERKLSQAQATDIGFLRRVHGVTSGGLRGVLTGLQPGAPNP